MKKLPPALVLSFALELVSILVFGVHQAFHDPTDVSVSMNLASTATAFASHVLAIAGFVELARRSSGRVAKGLGIAATGFVLGLADMAFWHVFLFIQPHWGEVALVTFQRWSWFAINFVPLLGAVIAVSERDRRLAIAGIIALLVADPLPPLAEPMYSWIASSWRAQIALENALRFIELGALFWLSRAVADGEPARAPDSAAFGLRTIASGLWLRVVASVGVAGVTLLMMLGRAGEGAFGVLKLAIMGAAVINAISLVMIARGALGASRGGIAELSRMPLVLAGGAALWCLGVGLTQLPYLYRMLYGGDDAYGFSSIHGRAYVEALAAAVPLVTTAAVAAVVTAIGGFASRRGLEQLHAGAQGRGAAFVLLMLGSIGIQSFLLPKADSSGSAAFMTLVAAGCVLGAIVMIARLCTCAADSLHAEPGLPTAKII